MMSIMFLDNEPQWAARFHVDRHVSAHISSMAQVLQAAHVMTDGIATARRRMGNTLLVQSQVYMNTVYVRWARKSSENYDWAARLYAQLILEYELRFGKIHGYECLVDLLHQRPWQIPIGDLTPFPVEALPGRFYSNQPVESFRRYYFSEKQHIASWTRPAKTPEWWRKMQFEHDTKQRMGA